MCTHPDRSSVPSCAAAFAGAIAASACAFSLLIVAVVSAPARAFQRRRSHGSRAIDIQVLLDDAACVAELRRIVKRTLARAAQTWSPMRLPIDRVVVGAGVGFPGLREVRRLRGVSSTLLARWRACCTTAGDCDAWGARRRTRARAGRDHGRARNPDRRRHRGPVPAAHHRQRSGAGASGRTIAHRARTHRHHSEHGGRGYGGTRETRARKERTRLGATSAHGHHERGRGRGRSDGVRGQPTPRSFGQRPAALNA